LKLDLITDERIMRVIQGESGAGREQMEGLSVSSSEASKCAARRVKDVCSSRRLCSADEPPLATYLVPVVTSYFGLLLPIGAVT
jgi:hypothetical protein